jgi:hypothetical protein
VKLFGNGRAALIGDAVTAERLEWAPRRRSQAAPQILLQPRHGDPRREPWITPGWVQPAAGLEALRSRRGGQRWSYLPEVPGVLPYLRRLAGPPAGRGGLCVALTGLGRVGGVAATLLATTPTRASGIRELLISDVDAANQQRWLLELDSIARWRSKDAMPQVLPATISEVFSRGDVFLFAATDSVPPLGAKGDVRLMQFGPNRAIMRSFVDEARAAGYTGLFLVVSDPVELLAQAAFHDGNSDASGSFKGDGLAPERIAGLGLGVMWGRALACARRDGWERTVARFGAAYGPHGPDVVVFDDLRKPDSRRSDTLSRAAREGNVKIRNLGHLPYVGPGASSVGLMLAPLLAGEEGLASVLLDGIYFGAPARLDWGMYPTPRPLSGQVWETITDLHARMKGQARSIGLLWPEKKPG